MQQARIPAVRRYHSLSGASRVGLVLFGLILVAVIVGPLLWGRSATDQDAAARLSEPSLAHPLGTDRYGRDLLARLLEGGRWTLAGATAVSVGVSSIGMLFGAVAAAGHRRVDLVLGRLIEALLALPSLVVALALTSILGPSYQNLLLALIVTSWPWYARAYRALFLQAWSAPFVEGAIACGASRPRLFFRHVLPAVTGPAAVLATINLGFVVLNLTSLSFLGLGIQPPTPEWGAMINDARPSFQREPWQMIAPGACIALTVLSVNLAGDALRDLLDPRARRTARPRGTSGSLVHPARMCHRTTK